LFAVLPTARRVRHQALAAEAVVVAAAEGVAFAAAAVEQTVAAARAVQPVGGGLA
jgi:hypothetical protein